MTSSPRPQENIDWVAHVLKNAQLPAGSIIVLPECFACFGAGDKAQLAIREPVSGGDYAEQLFALAKELDCHIVAGTMPAECDDNTKFSAACRVIERTGCQLAVYNKIHLFDVEVDDKTGSYRESATTQAGDHIVVAEFDNLRVGVAVCYDVRFPALFEAMGDLDVLVLPSAFTQKTGEAHWETLVRARAIEKQCYVIAANQSGEHENGRQTYGHSIIVSPWGEVLAEKHQGQGCIQANADLSKVREIKTAMPVSKHSKFRSHFVK
jgi:predicted amidohydrolase